MLLDGLDNGIIRNWRGLFCSLGLDNTLEAAVA